MVVVFVIVDVFIAVIDAIVDVKLVNVIAPDV